MGAGGGIVPPTDLSLPGKAGGEGFFGDLFQSGTGSMTGLGLVYNELVKKPRQAGEKLADEQRAAQKKLENKALDQQAIDSATRSRDQARLAQTMSGFKSGRSSTISASGTDVNKPVLGS